MKFPKKIPPIAPAVVLGDLSPDISFLEIQAGVFTAKCCRRTIVSHRGSLLVREGSQIVELTGKF
ncbi:MAG: hypothetical protein WBV90_03785 [Terrimicrobiaceae bacterium]